jgi:hypothetical protein
MKSIILCLALCLAIFTIWPGMGEVQVISEIVAKGNGTVYTEVQTTKTNLHDQFVALSPGGLVYMSQVNGQNVSMNATEAISQQLEMELMGIKTIKPIRDPFKIQVPRSFGKL